MIIKDKRLVKSFVEEILPCCTNKIIIANTVWLRFRGLTLRNRDCSILLCNCNDVHTFSINKNIDIYFFDENFNLLQKVINAKPCGRYKNSNAAHVFEKFSEYT